MSSQEKNVIRQKGSDRHVIMKYDFKVINPNDVVDGEHGKVDKNLVNDISEKKELQKSKQIDGTPPKEPQQQPVQAQESSGVDSGLVEKLLSRHDDLATALASIQSEIKKQQAELEDKLKNERDRGYNDGYEKGKQEERERLEASVEESKKSFVESIELVSKESEAFEGKIDSIEKELSAIATDIAKEIITVEVKERGKEIALSLAKALVENLKEATKIKIKVNPVDFEYLKSNLSEDNRIKVEPDKAIAKGGVVLFSDKGNVDGNVMSRYQTLKRSILESN